MNMRQPVTDPELLAELEGKTQSQPLKMGNPVTDPELLKELEGTASQQLSKKAQQQAASMEGGRRPQMQEEFSNPSIWPGFQNLPKGEQLQRLQQSQFDPANVTPTGTMVPGGAYEAPATRMAASVLPTALMPELSLGQGIAARYALNPLANLGARVGAGTASDVAYNIPNIQNMQDLKDVAKRGAIGSGAVEAATLPFRIPAYFAEMFNPLKYGVHKTNQIKNELAATQATMDEMYRPINQKYGQSHVTDDPVNYLENVGIKRKSLYPNAKEIFDKFKESPTYENLSALKTQLGRDYAKISTSPDKVSKAQLFQKHQNSLNDLKKDFLSGDENALNQLNVADNYAANHYFPYLSTPTLRKIARGKLDVSPNALSKSIQKASEKTVGIGKAEKSLIPESHPLRMHMNDLNRMIDFGRAMQFTVPAVGGAIGGELLHPGIGGALAGGAGTLGAAQLSKMASKFGAPSMTDFMQTPLVQNIFGRTAPPYYLGGRAGVNVLSENQ